MDKMEEQLRLEKECKHNAEIAIDAIYERAIQDKSFTRTFLGKKLVKFKIETLEQQIETCLPKLISDTYVHSACAPLIVDVLKYSDIKEFAGLSAATILRVSLNLCFSSRVGWVPISNIVNMAMKELEDEMKFLYLQSISEDDAKFREENIKKRSSGYYRQQFVDNALRKLNVSFTLGTTKQKGMYGAKLVDILVGVCPYFAVTIGDTGIKSITFSDWVDKAAIQTLGMEKLKAHGIIPCVTQPKPWNALHEGGYYGELKNFSSLLRLRPNNSIFYKQYKKNLKYVDLSYFYTCINHLQNTKYCINKDMLSIIKQIIKRGGNIGGVPSTKPLEKLPRLVNPTAKELKDYKKKLSNYYHEENRRKSIILRLTNTIANVEKFATYEEIYFPFNMDYRGRIYPLPTAISPQGDDKQKALLQFVDVEPITDVSCLKWFYVNGANYAGVDKVSFEDRIAWVKEHDKDICMSAESPLSYLWWSVTAENDYPLEFLAWCLEYKKLKDYIQLNGSAIGFKSYLPVNFDGSCSGLQHYSALLKDEVGGKAVNLIPADKPSDIYQIVADKVNKQLFKDALKNDKCEIETKKDKDGETVEIIKKYAVSLASTEWINFCAKVYGSKGITRKVCKRSVMTLPYGSKQYGFKENLYEDIIKPHKLEYPDSFLAPKKACGYLAKLIWDAVNDTVKSAVDGMRFLQKIAAVVAHNSVVTWITPNGLPVQQTKMIYETQIIKPSVQGSQIRIYISKDTGNIDKKRQASSIAPNFIHSLDACHMQRVITEMKQENINNCWMIHDSFGTDLVHADRLFHIIREEFVKLYEDNTILADFVEGFNGVTDISLFPPLPNTGKLDIKQVLNSNYCFA
jgi:DNA-directed RNA polymerase